MHTHSHNPQIDAGQGDAGLYEPQPDDAASDVDAALSGDDNPGLDALPVELRFEAGALRIPFGEIKAIEPGFVFELDKPLDQRLITVFANDVPVAEGELVSVGELVGVQIRRLLLPQSSETA